LQREPPAQFPERRLALLLDTGLRMWGVPRVLATGVALSLRSHGPSKAEAVAWYGDGEQLAEADLLSREGLKRHLETLTLELDLGEVLAEFGAAAGLSPLTDAVVITHRDALEQSDLRSRLAALKSVRGFLVLVET